MADQRRVEVQLPADVLERLEARARRAGVSRSAFLAEQLRALADGELAAPAPRLAPTLGDIRTDGAARADAFRNAKIGWQIGFKKWEK